MTEQMEEIFSTLDTLSLQLRSSNQEERDAFEMKISEYKMHVDYLESFMNYLNREGLQIEQYLVGFLMVKCVMEQRGCLLDLDTLLTILDVFKNMCCKQIIANNKNVMTFYSGAVAISYRLYIELDFQNNQYEPFWFQLIESSDPCDWYFGLNLMNEIIGAMKKPLKHMTEMEQKKLQSEFQKFHLARYFRAANNVLQKNWEIKENDDLIVDSSLKLILGCLNFIPALDIDKFHFFIPPNMLEFYKGTVIPDLMFRISGKYFSLQKFDLCQKAIEILLYFSSPTENCWGKIQFDRNSFYLYIAQNLTNILKLQLSDENVLLSISRLVFKFSTIVQINQFLQTSIAENFFMVVQEISQVTFSNIYAYKEPCMFFLRFWSHISNTSKTLPLPQKFIEMFSNVFKNYVDGLLLSVENINEDAFNQKFDNFPTFVEENRVLWNIGNISPVGSANYIFEKVNELTEMIFKSPNTSAIYGLTILFLIITSKFVVLRYNIFSSEDAVQQLSILLNCIILFINITNDKMDMIISNYFNIFPFVEKALCLFASTFKRDFFAPVDRLSNLELGVYNGILINGNQLHKKPLLICSLIGF